MSSVAIVYHSGYGHTKAVAEAVNKGVASVAGTTAYLISVTDIEGQWQTLAKADAIIFGSPTYMGSASAPMKAFMDASSKVWFTQGWKDKLAAGFTVSSNQSGDKLATLQQLVTFALQHSM
ncbi:MAG TPA: flavodoxin family protein, partial [Casimicrobium sp.]|nr:flavodoxin family protein [Casimicrobium sp.]